MKSVGEAMAIGRTFQQAFAKAMRSRELDATPRVDGTREQLLERLERPSSERYDILLAAFRAGAEPEEVNALTHIDLWFLRELQALALDPEAPFSGTRSYRAVDTCAAEFEAETPYFYSGWERDATPRHEVRRGDRPSVVILGAGPNRIGQGIEFDYCCVHAAMTVRASGRDAVMINCNPETVSTDYDTSDRLYFEPLTLEDVLGVVEIEQPEGVIVQFGGQTPLKLAAGLQERGVPILGTSVDAIDLAEDRGRFGDLLDRLGYQAPPYATAHGVEEALAASARVGFPLLVRPSYVLGGRAMEIVYDEAGLADYLERTAPPRRRRAAARDLPRPLPGERDRARRRRAVRRRTDVWIGGIMQHVEEAGIHSGDSACVLPPHSLGPEMLEEIRATTRGIALALGTLGLINIQYAVYSGEPVHHRGQPARVADGAVRVQGDRRPAGEDGLPDHARRAPRGPRPAVRGDADRPRLRQGGGAAVRPLRRLGRAAGPRDALDGRGHGHRPRLPDGVRQGAGRGRRDPARRRARSSSPSPTATRPAASGIAALLGDLGFRVVATAGTAHAIRGMGVRVDAVLEKIGDGSPNVVDCIEPGEVDLIINTPTGSGARADGWEIRRAAVARGIPCITTLSGGHAAARAIAAARHGEPTVLSLQEIHRERAGGEAPAVAPRRAAVGGRSLEGQ